MIAALQIKEKWNQNTKQKKSEIQKKGTFYHCLLSYANVAVKQALYIP